MLMARKAADTVGITLPKRRQIIRRDLQRNWMIYCLLIPAIVYYIVFHYIPMGGVVIAFQKYKPARGILGSSWVGFKNFQSFFNSYYFGRLIRNTLLINVYDILFGFTLPIFFALMLNEVRNSAFKRVIQTVTYIPHFISMVVICGMLTQFCSMDGLFNDVIKLFGGTPIPLLQEASYFRTIYVGSGIWQQMGWNSIVYLAAMTTIDQSQYEAATVDGASHIQQIFHVTLPGILPVIVMQLILRCGRMMTVGADKILLLYNASTYETADVISTFVYRKGLLDADYSYATAVGLFNSLANLIVLTSVNKLCRVTTENSLW